MAFDFKKEYRDLYQPKATPAIVEVPPMSFLTVQGAGDPNDPDGAYARALNQLYAIAYTLKMSYKTDYAIEGFYQYVVPPLEGFWWQPGVAGVDFEDKASFQWVSAIRVPEFVGEADFSWAVDAATTKKKLDFSDVRLVEIDEGLCVQCMHIGPYDDEPTTVAAMDGFAVERGYVLDFSDERHHHEIYLSDPRKTDPVKLKTVIRHPIRKSKGRATTATLIYWTSRALGLETVRVGMTSARVTLPSAFSATARHGFSSKEFRSRSRGDCAIRPRHS